ncbi:MAG: lytic transglycosylase domain-containing protein [Terriglobales bacterium]|jgi:hypothetical protein
MNRIMLKPGPIFAALLCVAAVFLVAQTASAADIAILRNGFTIRHDHRIVIGEMTRLFTSADDSSFTDIATSEITGFEKDLTPPPPAPATTSFPATGPARMPAAAPPPVDLNQVVSSAGAQYKLDPDLLNSVIHAESGFNVRARSPKGAQGLMQLMPSTANTLGVNNVFDPEQNVDGGSRYLRELLERYNFDLVKALAAYNAGPQRVEQYHGVPPFRETRAYVARIIKEYNRKIDAQEKAEALAKKHAAPQTAAQTTKAAHPKSTKSASDTKKQSAKLSSHTASSASPLASAPAPDSSPR